MEPTHVDPVKLIPPFIINPIFGSSLILPWEGFNWTVVDVTPVPEDPIEVCSDVIIDSIVKRLVTS